MTELSAGLTKCADCGLSYIRGLRADELHHRRFHDEAVGGPKTTLKDGFHVIATNSSNRNREIAARASVLAKRDAKYDFPAYLAYEDNNAVAFILVLRRRVVGLVVTRERVCDQRATVESLSRRDSGDSVPSALRRSIEMVWVLKKYRRQGFARQLIVQVAKHFGLPLEAFAHTTPITDDALALWRRLGLKELYILPG